MAVKHHIAKNITTKMKKKTGTQMILPFSMTKDAEHFKTAIAILNLLPKQHNKISERSPKIKAVQPIAKDHLGSVS